MTPVEAVRPARLTDLEGIVDVHMRAFQGFFLTSLGRAFLRQLYRAFMSRPGGICYVAEHAGGGSVAGFVAGTSEPDSFFRALLFRRGPVFLLAAVPGMLLQPHRVLPRLWGAVRYRGEAPAAPVAGALLSSLGVDPQCSRSGLGRRLVDAFCREAAARGVSMVYLTTDHRGNAAANNFYVRSGFRLVSTRPRQDGRIMNTYVRSLPERAPITDRVESE